MRKKLEENEVPATPSVDHSPYRGRPNVRLDRDIQSEDVRTALYDLNSRSVPGVDLITRKALKKSL